MEIVRSALGWIETMDTPYVGDVISGHSMGLSVEEGSPNWALAKYIETTADGRPVIADTMLVRAFEDPSMVTVEVAGEVSNTLATVGGAYGVLRMTQMFMNQNDLKTAELVAARYHVGRLAMQAKSLGMATVIPPDLPSNFDLHACRQWWTRNRVFWVPREVIGSFDLARRGQLDWRDLF
jgi:hypothetical protein